MPTSFPIFAVRPRVAMTRAVALASLFALSCQAPVDREVTLDEGAAPSASMPPSHVQLASRENGGGHHGTLTDVPGGLKGALSRYLDAYSRSDWSSVWRVTATSERESLVSLGRHPAERSQEAAKAQGFASSEEVRGVTDEGWFTANRTALAKAGRLPAMPAAEGLKTLAVTPVVMPGDTSGRQTVAVSFVTDSGATVVLGAVMQGSEWRFLSPRTTGR